MASHTERCALAQHHVDRGLIIIERHRQLVARDKALGRDTTASEKLLASFERAQAIFEDDLAAVTHQIGFLRDATWDDERMR